MVTTQKLEQSKFQVFDHVNIKVTCERFEQEEPDDNRSITFEGLYLAVRYDFWIKSYSVTGASNNPASKQYDDFTLGELATLLHFLEKTADDFESVWNFYPHPDGVGRVDSCIEVPGNLTPVALVSFPA
jgi:hypothetical protein